MKSRRLQLCLLALILVSCQEPKSTGNEVLSGTIKVTIMYANGDDKTFDMDYYTQSHMPMLAELFGKAMIKYEIDEGMAGRTPDDPLPYLAIGYLHFNSLSDYQEAFGPNAEQILNDIPNYTNIRPTVQISKVVK